MNLYVIVPIARPSSRAPTQSRRDQRSAPHDAAGREQRCGLSASLRATVGLGSHVVSMRRCSAAYRGGGGFGRRLLAGRRTMGRTRSCAR